MDGGGEEEEGRETVGSSNMRRIIKCYSGGKNLNIPINLPFKPLSEDASDRDC